MSANTTWYVDIEVPVVETVRVSAVTADEASEKIFRNNPGRVNRVLSVKHWTEVETKERSGHERNES